MVLVGATATTVASRRTIVMATMTAMKKRGVSEPTGHFSVVWLVFFVLFLFVVLFVL